MSEKLEPVISSQDFRNTYQRFYTYVRNYLWPYSTLVDLAAVEDDIYTSFIDYDKLSRDLSKLYTSIKEICKEDDDLNKAYNEFLELIEAKNANPAINIYSLLQKVEETNPEQDKTLKFEEDKDNENSEESI